MFNLGIKRVSVRPMHFDEPIPKIGIYVRQIALVTFASGGLMLERSMLLPRVAEDESIFSKLKRHEWQRLLVIAVCN